MADYISREALAAHFLKLASEAREQYEEFGDEAGIIADTFFDAAVDVKNFPSADAAEVRRGRWECVYDDNTGETDITCSHCKNTRTVNGCFVSTDGKSCYFEDDYCPSCGAKMDLEELK